MDLLKVLNIFYVWLCLLKLERLLKLRKALTIRRWWVKPHLKNHIRDTLGGYRLIFVYFKLQDHEEFKRFIGLSVATFDRLLNIVRRRLTRSGPRKPLSAELKLAIVLRIGKSTMFKLIAEVCSVIVEKLMPLYFPPLNKNTWLKIAREYEEQWNVPHCLGAIDGKHFSIKKPPHSGSVFYNYKSFFSLVLMASCDANRRFTWFNFGEYGSANDASIFNKSNLKELIDNGELEIPEPCPLPGSNYQNKSEVVTEVGNQLIRDKRGLDSFPSWDPNTSTAIATAIALLMCTTPPPKGKGRCRIKVNDLKPEHSLILDPADPTQFLYPDDDGYMEFDEGEPVLLSCTTTEGITFEKIPETVSKTFLCVCEDRFAADNHIYPFEDLGCTKVPKRHVRQEDDVETYSKYQIGFQTTPDHHFLNLIDVYYDSTSNYTAYVKETISKHKKGSQKTIFKNIPFEATYHPYEDADSYYTADKQLASFRVQLNIPEGQEVPYLSRGKMLNRGQLVPKSSMVYTAAAIATHEHLNVVPQYELINAHNWAKIEDHAVNMATELKRDLVVVTGTYEQQQRPISDEDFVDMYLYAVQNGENLVQRVPIPKYTYKIIMDVENRAGVVYVTVNDPFMNVDNADSYYLCDRHFTGMPSIKPPKQWKPKDPKMGFSYICRLDEFLEKTQLSLLETPAAYIENLLFLPSGNNVHGAYGSGASGTKP